jgi:predicted NAD-dependent protein-ADP-ribosyltransferase YbiA (DUF1768 family)/hypoxanthine phosphoribosyltransferase
LFFEENTLADGSVNVSDIHFSSHFFKEGGDGVCGNLITTRGYNYICSLDSALTSVQKIKKYKETIYKVVESLSEIDLSKIEKLLLLDYLKNGLITILNSFVYQEKIGSQSIDTSLEYEAIRSELNAVVEKVINCSVSFILDNDLNNVIVRDSGEILSVTDRAVSKLVNYHEEYKLPSFYVSRPEATHPLTIIGSALLCADRYKDVDTVIGIPSGGTEFAFTVKVFINRVGKKDAKLVLLPVSLHSLKQFSNEGEGNNLTQLSIERYLGDTSHSVLICDDNTSTGKTLQFLKDSILDSYPNVQVFCAVAEADTTRSQIDKNNSKRTHIANKNVYRDSVNILPVSKSIDPKVDLKEIIEKRKIISYYRNMEEKSLSVVDRIYARVMSHVNESGVDYDSFTPENAVLNFHGTFLSNFYVAPVNLKNKTYPTVEHAYQAAKFFDVDWGMISQEAKNEIKEALNLRGYAEEVVYNDDLFSDTRMVAGSIKIIADILRKHGYVDKEWEDKRIKIMIELLVQKFSIEDMLSKLKETSGKELVEGNTWNDTLWGVCEGKGRNILGIILMEIRTLNIKGS